MTKSFLREDQKMNVAAAKEMAAGLVQRESRGPGDLDNAMRRIEMKYGVPYSVLWGLRYRQPKDILLGAFTKLRAAYQAECSRQVGLLEHELMMTKAVSDDLDTDLVEEVEAMVRKVRERQAG